MIRLRSEWRNVKIGAAFGEMTVIGEQFRVRNSKNEVRWMVVVECDSGNIKVVYCDFLGRKATALHGFCGTALYVCWNNIKQRCLNPKNKYFHHYGGRGITYCPEWEQFEPFMEWALANGYQPGLEIDRQENNGNYEPNNCRFVTRKVNLRNRRTNTYITAWGETKTLVEWSEDSRCQVEYNTLVTRLRGKTKRDWTAETAISTDSRSQRLRK